MSGRLRTGSAARDDLPLGWWRFDLRQCERRSAPEDGGGVVVDLVEERVGSAGIEVVVAVPAAVAVGPVERPEVVVGVVAELGDGEPGPVGEVGMPGWPAVVDGDGLPPDVRLDPSLASEVGGDS